MKTTGNDIKEVLQSKLPKATKIKVRVYPTDYKGSMRGYTTVTVYGYSYSDAKQTILSNVPQPDKTFVDCFTN